MKQKIIAAFLIISTLIPTGVFASEKRANLTSQEIEIAQNIVNDLEILEYSESNLDDIVSRVDFAVYLSRLFKVNEYELSETTYYTDISTEHYGLSAVNYLTQMGALDGYGDSKFRPDDPITPIDAAKVIFDVLGYRTYASLMGGYTKAYYDLAKDTGLLDGFTGCENITRGELAVLLFRAGLTNTADITQLKGNNITFQSKDSATVFEKYWDIYEKEGIITTSGDISISDKHKGMDGYVTLNDEFYSYDDNSEKFLGRFVQALVYESKDKNELLYAVVNSKKTNELCISSKDIEKYENYIINYTDNEKIKKAKIATDANVIYNGTFAEYGIAEIINNMYKGDIYLIDVTDDNYADTVIINEYKTYVVGHVDKENEIIFDELSNKEILNLEDYNHKKFYSANGGELSMNSIVKGTVINVKESNGTYADIYISNAIITGKISNIFTEDDELYVKVDDTEYKFDKSYIDNGSLFKNGLFQGKVGESYTFFIDMFNEIAYVSEELTDISASDSLKTKQAGYIIDIKTVYEQDEYVKIKLLKTDGSIVVYQTAEKTEVDGFKYKNPDAIANAISIGDGKVIGFKANEDNIISLIDTTYKSERENENTLELVTPLERADWEPADSRYPGCRQWFKGNQSYSGVIMASATTVVFGVPEDSQQKDDDYYTVLNWSTFEDGRQRKCQSYKFGKDSFYDDIIVEFDDSGASVSMMADMFVINSITKELNSDDEVVYRLDGFTKSKQTSYLVEEICMKRNFSNEANTKKYTVVEQLTPGSIVQLAINSQGRVNGMRLLVDYSAGFDTIPDFANNANYGLASNSYRVTRLFCNDRNSEGIECSYSKGGVTTWKSLNNNVSVTIVDTSKKKDKISVGTIDDIRTFEMYGYQVKPMYVYSYRFQLRDVVVYK